MYQHLKAKSPRSSHRSQAGQGLVEFAMVLPFLMMILLGIVDLGRLYFAYDAVINSAREGARYGAEYPYDLAGIDAYVKKEPNTLVTVTTTMTPLCTYDAFGRSLNDPTGTPITVTVQSNFQLITTYVLGGGQIPLRASNTWEIFHSCEH